MHIEQAVHSDDLMDAGSDAPFRPMAWGTLSIDLRLMSPEQKDAAIQGVRLLQSAGVRFDTGVGFGTLDVELDWSLAGAVLHVHPFNCVSCRSTGFSQAYWVTFRRRSDGYIVSFPLCSVACRDELVQRRTAVDVVAGFGDCGSDVLVIDTSPALVVG